MGKIRGRRARSLRLAFCHVDLDTNRPRHGEYGDEDIDGDDDDPAACSGGVVHRVPRVEAADKKHGKAEPEAAANGAVSTAPFVGEEQGRDGHAEYDNRGNAGSEKRSF